MSLPPRPSVVMFKSSSIPWKPAAMTMLPSSRSPAIRSVEIDWIRALVCVLSVMMPIWPPVKLIAFVAQRVNRHRHQRHADLLAGRQEHVHFPGRRLVGDLAGQVDQHVGVLAHGADDHHDLVPLALGANGLPRRGENLLDVGHARAAELLNDDGHGLSNLQSVKRNMNRSAASSLLKKGSDPLRPSFFAFS